jgi:hypothetical protein
VAGTFSLSVNGLTQLQALAQSAPAVAGRQMTAAMEASLVVLHAAIAERTPVNRGILRGSIFTAMQGNPDTGLRGIVSTPIDYAIPVERGTRPHVIQGHGQMLRFVIGGRVIYRRFVMHPGTRGAHMFRDGLKAASPTVRALFASAVQRTVATLRGGR